MIPHTPRPDNLVGLNLVRVGFEERREAGGKGGSRCGPIFKCHFRLLEHNSQGRSVASGHAKPRLSRVQGASPVRGSGG